MLRLTIKEWIDLAKVATNDALVKCMSNEEVGFWQENTITAELLYSLQKIGTEITWLDKSLRTTWKALKLNVPAETNFGDIAVNVRIWVDEERSIDGVAFYEAKRQHFENGVPAGFKSIKKGQLGNISKNTGACNAVLYDYGGSAEKPRGIAASLPAPILELLADHAKKPGTSRDIYKRAQHWATSLSDNLTGRGLDFSESAVSAMAEIVASKTPPIFIVNVAVSFLDELAPQLDPIIESKYRELTQEHISIPHPIKKDRKNASKATTPPNKPKL